MVNEKNLVKGLIISASIIGGSILLTGVLSFLSHSIFENKKPHHPHEHNSFCERRIPNEHEHPNKHYEIPQGHMKKHEATPEFKDERKEIKPQENQKNSEPKNELKTPENKPKSNA